MKWLLKILMFTYCLNLFGQNSFHFADSTAQWNVLSVDYGCFSPPCLILNTITYYAEADTNINGVSYQIISEENQEERYFLRRDFSNKIFIKSRHDFSDYVLYDFNANKGDSLTILNDYYSVISQTVCVIDSVDTIVLDKQRKRLFVSYPNLGLQKDIWIEGIGAVNSHFIFPSIVSLSIEGPDIELLCFFENDELVLHDSVFILLARDTMYIDNCDIDSNYLSISEKEFDILKPYPNPFTEQCVLHFSKVFNNLSVKVYDTTGRIYLNGSFREQNKIFLERKSFGASGAYYYEIIADGISHKGKLLVY